MDEKLSPAQRQADILEYLSKSEHISIEQIVERYGVSGVTARNDLRALESAGKVRRTRGGASSVSRTMVALYPEERLGINVEAKQSIARLAASYVHDGDTIAVDSGTTTYHFVRNLVDKKDIMIVTNDISIASFVVFSIPGAKITMTGGALFTNRLYFTGPIATQTMRNLYVDKAFLCADSYSSGRGFTTRHEETSELKRLFIAHANQNFMLMDAAKVGNTSFSKFADLVDFDCLIMDHDPQGTMSADIETLREVWSKVPRLLLAGQPGDRTA